VVIVASVVTCVQLWDTRIPSRRLQRFSAHYGPAFSIDWHPTKRWLATGGRDKMIRVSMTKMKLKNKTVNVNIMLIL